MKKAFKIIGIVLATLVVLFALFLAAWVFIIFPNVVATTDNSIAEAEPGLEELAGESERIDMNTSNGMVYVNNEVVVFVRTNASQERVDEFFASYDAEIDDTMADIRVYKMIFPEAMTYEELESLVQEIQSDSVVEQAYLNTVSQFEEDAAEGETTEEDDFDYKDPVYPNDTWNNNSWNLDAPSGENWGMEAINAPGAWGYLDQLETVRVGLIDNMPNTGHEDLTFANTSCLFIDEDTGKTNVNAYTLSAQDHGTHVAGIMNARWDNGTGVSGVMGGKGELYYSAVYYDNGGSISSRYATAYSYLLALKTLIDQDVQVINISQNTSRLIGFAASHGNQNAIDYLTQQAQLTQRGLSRIIAARQAAGESDFVIVVAAGNSNSTYYYRDENATYGYREEMSWWEQIKYIFGWRGEIGDSLALYNNFLNLMDQEEVLDRVIVVGAIGIDGDNTTSSQTRYSYAYYSNVGDRVDVAAPGGTEVQSVYSCTAGGYGGLNGTSMAAPHVSGVAGLIFAANSSLTGPQVKEILLASTTGRFYYTGGYCGLVNAKTAVETALKTQDTSVNRVLGTGADGLDVCFVVDTTGSMGDDIDNAKENMTDILDNLAEKTSNYQVALIDYRDFSDRSGDSDDYPYEVQLQFTDNQQDILDAINDLGLGSGGDTEETVYSALMAAVGLDWRSDSKKVIILLGDAPPLDPEPNTDYTYEDVLLALFNADINIDYENSDERVADALDYSLINVYSIGTSASDDAEDFFQQISEETDGSYVGVDDASQVADAIMDSIEQIEVTALVDAQADFGDALGSQSVDLYRGEDYLFTFETDPQGQFTLDSMPEGEYRWVSHDLNGSGTLQIQSEQQRALVQTTQSYWWFTPIVRSWQQQGWLIGILLVVYLAVCILLPLSIRRGRSKRLQKKLAKQQAAAEAPVQTAPSYTPPPAPMQAPPPTSSAPVQAPPPTPSAPASVQAPPPTPSAPASVQAPPPTPAANQAPVSAPAPTPSPQFCPYCGKRCQEGDRFCEFCGADLTEE